MLVPPGGCTGPRYSSSLPIYNSLTYLTTFLGLSSNDVSNIDGLHATKNTEATVARSDDGFQGFCI
jgi:hypothetical protein